MFDLLSHDFAIKHGGEGTAGSGPLWGCEGEGLMSYGSKESPKDFSKWVDAWSSCSISDFEEWYRTHGYKCLKSYSGVPFGK